LQRLDKKQIMYLNFVIIPLLLSWLIGWRFKNRFQHYSQIRLSSGLTGRDVAAKMLQDNGIYDVTIQPADGTLSDHYNPSDKTVNLSADVYEGTSLASAAVAAHECGHAVQHAKAYAMLNLRSGLVPVMNLANTWAPWVILLGIVTITFFPFLMLAGIALLAVTVLFSFITLPVEFDASRRALAWLDNNPGIMYEDEHKQAKDALWWAAMTYVVAALASLGTLLYYLSILNRRN